VNTNPPLVISFFTKNTPYEQEAIEFMASCEKQGIEYEVEGLESQGVWDRNCAMKPAFILRKLHEKKRALLWVDIDGRFKRGFPPYDWEKADLSVLVNEKDVPGKCNRLCSGTIYCSYTPQTIALCKTWITLCNKYLSQDNRLVEVWDQDILQEALFNHPEVQFVPLPLKFCKISDFKERDILEEEIIIEQTQASRRLKEIINKDQERRMTPFEKEYEDFLALDFGFLVEVDETTIGKLEECLKALAFFSFKAQVIGNLSRFSDLIEFSRLKQAYPRLVFSSNEEAVDKQYLFRLRADHIINAQELFVWLLNSSWKDRLPIQFGLDGPLFIESGQSCPPQVINEDIFKK
jgi:hypothetical protein